jgi:hypothetical protein
LLGRCRRIGVHLLIFRLARAARSYFYDKNVMLNAAIVYALNVTTVPRWSAPRSCNCGVFFTPLEMKTSASLLGADRRRLNRFRRRPSGIRFVVHVAAAKERHPVEDGFLEPFERKVNHRRDVKRN